MEHAHIKGGLALQQVMVVGHRGAAGLYPENTLGGFVKAVELGVDAVECDVRLTRDGHPVILHDARVDRTTDGRGAVAEMTLAEVRRLDAGQGERIPTLDEVLDLVRGRTRILVELKVPQAWPLVVAALRARDMLEDAIVTCSDPAPLREVRAHDPAVCTGLIFDRPPADAVGRARDAGVQGFSVRFTHVSRELLDAAHAAGLVVRAWCPDTEEDLRSTLAFPVDGIATNRPDRLLELLGRPGPQRARVLEAVRTVVRQALAGLPARAYLFGSWSTGQEARASDIDVAVEPLAPLPAGTLARLREMLEEAPIPYRVDVVDLSTAEPAFRERVRKEGIPWIA